MRRKEKKFFLSMVTFFIICNTPKIVTRSKHEKINMKKKEKRWIFEKD